MHQIDVAGQRRVQAGQTQHAGDGVRRLPRSERLAVVGLKELREAVERFRPADAHDSARRAARRRGDGGNGVVEGVHEG